MTRRARDERGAVVVMVVAAVLFIAVAFGALLTYQSTTMNSQTVYEDKRSADLSADAALDLAIAKFQADHTKTCGTDPLLTYAPSGDHITVNCTLTGNANSSRAFTLVAKQASSTIATVDVTLYDPVSGSGPSVVSITRWSRS